jgi:hypothetical protein
MMKTDDELRKMAVAGYLIEPPAGDIIKELVEELLALREQTRWRKYPDEKPEVFTDVVVRLSGGAFIVARLFYGRTFWANGNVIPETVIEWQPLPSAPDAKGGE